MSLKNIKAEIRLCINALANAIATSEDTQHRAITPALRSMHRTVLYLAGAAQLLDGSDERIEEGDGTARQRDIATEIAKAAACIPAFRPPGYSEPFMPPAYVIHAVQVAMHYDPREQQDVASDEQPDLDGAAEAPTTEDAPLHPLLAKVDAWVDRQVEKATRQHTAAIMETVEAAMDVMPYFDRSGDGWEERDDRKRIRGEFSSTMDMLKAPLAESIRDDLYQRIAEQLVELPDVYKAMSRMNWGEPKKAKEGVQPEPAQAGSGGVLAAQPTAQQHPKILPPTVGRKVWFFPGDSHLGDGWIIHNGNPAQPMDATITYVWSDNLVNLLVLDHAGNAHRATSVPLAQPGDNRVYRYRHAQWMPYQIGQAKKESN